MLIKKFKHLVFSSLLLLTQADFGWAQSDNEVEGRKGYVAITCGPSYPNGDFGDNSIDNEKSGLAKNGIQYSITEFGIKFVKNFGLVAAIKGAVLPFDVQKLADTYAEENGGQFVVKGTRWGYTFIAAGPMIVIPSNRIELDFRLMTGIVMAASPQLNIIWDGVEVASQESAVGGGFGFSFGTCLKFHLTERFSVLAGGDYFTAKPQFETTVQDANGVQTGTFEQSFTTLGLNFGLAYRVF
jgi:hypothetical protein